MGFPGFRAGFFRGGKFLLLLLLLFLFRHGSEQVEEFGEIEWEIRKFPMNPGDSLVSI